MNMASCIFVFGIVHLFLKWFLHNFSFFLSFFGLLLWITELFMQKYDTQYGYLYVPLFIKGL